MIRIWKRCWLHAAIIGVCLLYGSPISSQKHMSEPITKEGLFKTLETRLTNSGLKYLIKRIQERGVSFELSDSDSNKLRALQKGLGQKRLNDLIVAIKNNYHPMEPSKEKSTMSEDKSKGSINQTMINSPGGIQAGGNVTIHNRPQPRALSQTELDRMSALLRPYANQTLFMVRLGDPEANRFASQIAQAFRAAGWQVKVADVGQQTPIYGLQLGVPDPQQLPPYARAVYSAFEQAGILVTITDLSHIFPTSFAMLVRAENGVVLHVGLKPEDK